LSVIRDDMAALKDKFGDERRTEIRDDSGNLSELDLIEERDVLVTLTERGYVKRSGDDNFTTQHRGGKGVTGVKMREEDAVKHILSANTHDSLLVFTSRGKVYQLKVHELPDVGRTARGMPIINLLNMQPDEQVTTLLKVRDYSDAKNLFFTTRLGRIKRTTLDQFASVRAAGLIAIGLDEGDELVWVRMTSGDNEIMLVTRNGQAIRFNEDEVRAMGRPAAGVIGIRMEADDQVIASEVVLPDHDLLVVSSKGLGKRTKFDQYRKTGRGGKGVTAMNLTLRTGNIVSAAMIDSSHTVMMMSSSGRVIRIRAEQIPTIGRATQGVSLMRLLEGETVASMTATPTRDGENPDGLGDLNGSSVELTAG
ncbi:MAG: DNA gyrase C-terminal beta-propeller domain-containing protein, partial [Thermomicrobiales bacterium]